LKKDFYLIKIFKHYLVRHYPTQIAKSVRIYNQMSQMN